MDSTSVAHDHHADVVLNPRFRSSLPEPYMDPSMVVASAKESSLASHTNGGIIAVRRYLTYSSTTVLSDAYEETTTGSTSATVHAEKTTGLAQPPPPLRSSPISGLHEQRQLSARAHVELRDAARTTAGAGQCAEE